MLWSANRVRSAAWKGWSRSTAGTGHRAPTLDHCLATIRRAGGGPRRMAAASARRSPHPRRRGRRRRQPAADPPARRLTTFRVVAGQIGPAPMRRIQRRHLADQIVVTVAGRQSVEAHRHTNQRRHEDARRSGDPAPPCTGCIQHLILRMRRGYVGRSWRHYRFLRGGVNEAK